ncbi:hypothetical protein E2C01_053658 [Portunus trituberculatus]|uniref:Uncharacterized protein n=1 Tax=Portunus trituberculatus TaxID=210409 RepID=A0A5B7GSW4_PORTR|nr:hypothetical protein [Portunus trituberculatus]
MTPLSHSPGTPDNNETNMTQTHQSIHTSANTAHYDEGRQSSIRISSCLATPSSAATVLPNKEQGELQPTPSKTPESRVSGTKQQVSLIRHRGMGFVSEGGGKVTT